MQSHWQVLYNSKIIKQSEPNFPQCVKDSNGQALVPQASDSMSLDYNYFENKSSNLITII